MTASGSWNSLKALRPIRFRWRIFASTTGSSGGANGSLSMTTSDSASPRMSMPSQKLTLPTSTALPAAR